MNNLTGEVHEEELNSSSYYVEGEVQNSLAKSNLGQTKTKKSSLEQRTTQLPKEAAIDTAQKVLTEEGLSLPAAIIFYASPLASLTSKEEDITQKFVKKFNNHRGNQEFLARAYRMLYKTRCLAGLVPNSKVIDIPSARKNFFLLAQLNHQDIKLAALDNLIAVLQKDEVTRETAFDLIDLAINLMLQLDRELIQTQLIEEQIKICKAYGMVAELIQWHYGKKHFNGITDDLKRQLIHTLNTLEDLNTQDNIELHFAVEYALEGFKRLKDDKKELFELGERVAHFLVGVISIYNDAPNVQEIGLAFKDIDVHIKHSWYNLTLLFNDMEKSAYTQFNSLTALELMVDQNWKDLNWKFLYNALQKFADITIQGSTPEIRLAAFQGMSVSNQNLPGLLNFTGCNFFKTSINKKPLVHFKSPTKKDVNIFIRLLAAQQLIRISQEAPDAAVRNEAKEAMLYCSNRETEPSILEVLKSAIPTSTKNKKKWLAEIEDFAYKPSKSKGSFNDSERVLEDPVDEYAQGFFSHKTTTPVQGQTPEIPSSQKVLKRRATQNALLSSTSSTKITPSDSPYISSTPTKSSKRLSAPSGSYLKQNPTAARLKKNQPIGDHHPSSGSVQANLLAKCLNIDPEIIAKSIEFNQDIHLGDNNKLHLTKAGIQKLFQMMEEVRGITTLDFKQCQIPPEGLIYLAKNLSLLKEVNKVYLPSRLPKEVLAALGNLKQNDDQLILIFADSEDDLHFGNLLVKSDSVNEGIEYYHRALKNLKNEEDQSPLKFQILLSLGNALEALEEYVDATKALMQAYQIDPQNYSLVSKLASLFARQGDYIQADEFYRASLAIKPSDYENYETIDMVELNDIFNKQHQKYNKIYSE